MHETPTAGPFGGVLRCVGMRDASRRDVELGNNQGTFRELSTNIQGTFRQHFIDIQGTIRELSGIVLSN
jgi:hypothetical protein